ncbi:MAG TPA: hypothetical protein VEY68_05515 [Anoxybacillus sp.]|nr:hypothetical protein [Anoxybacillus sp.]
MACFFSLNHSKPLIITSGFQIGRFAVCNRLRKRAGFPHEPLPPTRCLEVGVSYQLHRRSFSAEEGCLLLFDELIGSLLDRLVSNIGFGPMGRNNPSTTSCLRNP